MVELGPLALATFPSPLGLSKLALGFHARFFVVASTLDLAQHTFARHEPTQLSDRSLDPTIVDLDLERPALDGLILCLVISAHGRCTGWGLFGSLARHEGKGRDSRGAEAGGQAPLD